MCGACGRALAGDEWTSSVATRRDRWEATRLMNRALAAGSHPARVMYMSGVWVVRGSTGAALLADTLTELWQHCAAARAISEPTLSTLAASASSPVASAVHAAAASIVQESTRALAGRSQS